ncbi:aquaporin [Aquipuribacter sp. SD81]|uniref:aquaporin n=1 Tax=Aquipuribacter sp. SD81 TaxID=3127703 RepID=UPI003018CAB4
MPLAPVDDLSPDAVAGRRRTLLRKALAELVGTALLLATVVGSGVAATRLTPDDVGAQLLYNSVATGAVLTALILALGPVSAAFNPVVTLVERALGALDNRSAAALVAAQCLGGAGGVVLANLMFELPAVSTATTVRSGPGMWLAEVVATFGLVLVVFGVVRTGQTRHVAVAVGAYITAAYWFTSSTSFANPAVTLARTLSDTFAGIAPASVPPFVLAQLAGGAVALLVVRVLHPDPRAAARAVVHHAEEAP